MERKVERVRTDISEPQMAQAIIMAWKDLFGNTPSKEQVSMILAQNNLETGHRKSMWNYNVGNITHAPGDGFDYWEGLDWLYEYFTDTSGFTQKQKKTIQLKYRAYPSLDAGVKDYLKFLNSKRYGGAFQHIVNPDPVAYSKALKQSGYYTADEASYTAGVKNLFNQANKSNSYELAMSGKVAPAPGSYAPAGQAIALSPKPGGTFDQMIDHYIQMLSAASDMPLKKLYKKALPNNDILITITAPDYASAIEFGRVLCAALDEDLLSTSYTHTDGQQVEVECSINGPAKECYAAVEQFAEAVAEAFKDATKKIGGITVITNCIMNKKSSYQPISLRTADTNYRKFLLKFI
jgi:hypothetical protein